MPVAKGFPDLQLPEAPHRKLPYAPSSSYLRLYSAYEQTDHIQELHQAVLLLNVPDSGKRLLSFVQTDLQYFCLPCIRQNLFPVPDVRSGNCLQLRGTVVSLHLQMVQCRFSFQ